MRTIDSIKNTSLPEDSSAGKLTYSTDVLSNQGQRANPVSRTEQRPQLSIFVGGKMVFILGLDF